MEHTYLGNLKVALHYETTGRIKEEDVNKEEHSHSCTVLLFGSYLFSLMFLMFEWSVPIFPHVQSIPVRRKN